MTPKRPDNIVLIGFMGTGKSTVGRALAARLGWIFVDSDLEIEVDAQMSIPDIFQLHGEAHFRQRETNVLGKILSRDKQIIATGGGAVLAEMNRIQMLNHGWVVALQASEDTIVARVTKDPLRPLLQGDVRERVSTLLAQRKEAYQFADICIQTDGRAVDQIVEQIIQALPSHPST